MKSKKDPYEIITGRIIAQLESGTVPWLKPWKGGQNVPRNLITGKPYQGLNAILLHCVGFSSPFFLTFTQAKQKGGFVKKGEKGLPVIFWKFRELEDKESRETRTVPFCRTYSVFNITQCENIQAPGSEDGKQLEFVPIMRAENIIKNYQGKPDIRHDEQSAYYHPKKDFINMPKQESFLSVEEYYSVLFHEAVHSSGHEKRLNREGVTEPHFFGDENYSKEELVAEIGACFLQSECSICSENIFKNSTSYINNWLKRLQNDKRLVISAASKARAAVDYILGRSVPSKI